MKAFLKRSKWFANCMPRRAILIACLIVVLPAILVANEKDADTRFKNAREQVSTNPNEALVLANEILKDYGYQGNDSLLAKVAYLMGTANLYLGRGLIAAEHFKHALTFDFMQQNIELREASWNNLGIAYDLEGKMESALEAYNISLGIAGERNDSTSIMQSMINIGLLDKKSGNYERAIDKFETSLKFFTRQSDTLNMGLSHQNLGATYLDMSQLDAAEAEGLKALECFRAVAYKAGQIEIKNNLANIYRDKGEYQMAIDFIEKAFLVNKTFGSLLLEGNLQTQLASIYILQRNFRQAEAALQRAFSIFAENFTPDYQLYTVQVAMRLYAHTGNIQKYLEAEAMLSQISEAIQTEINIKSYNQLSELYQHKENIAIIEEQQIKLLNKNRNIAYLSVILLILVAISTIAITLYLRISRYQRLLFRQRVQELNVTKPQPDTSSADVEEYDKFRELYKNIVAVLERKKMYTDSSVTVAFLANELNTNDKYISTAIGKYGETTFTALINGYRIDEACRLLLDIDRGYKMTDVARLSGYNDPSTFYRNFKDSTGLTPLQFLKLKPQEQTFKDALE